MTEFHVADPQVSQNQLGYGSQWGDSDSTEDQQRECQRCELYFVFIVIQFERICYADIKYIVK